MPEAFLHIDQISLIIGYQLIARTIIIFFFVSLFGYICFLMIKRFDQLSETVGKYQALLRQTTITVEIFIILCIPGLVSLSSIDGTKFFGLPTTPPEIALASAIKQFCFLSQSKEAIKLPDDLKNYISHQYGIYYKQHAEYPLVKDWIYQKPIPFNKLSNKPSKPNVIIFFVESLSANLVGSYNSRMKTPNIDIFSREAMIVDGYYNHTFPTISGIRGQLCSFYPVLGENEYAEQEGIALKLFCLPHVLNRNNYSTYFFSSSPALITPFSNTLNLKRLVEACGFSKVYVAEDIHKRLSGLDNLEGYKFKGVNDKGMMVNLVNYLKEYKNDSKPFFIVVSTIGTHPSIEDRDEKIGESLHELDDAFGVFWEYFKKSPFYENTIVVVTADHAIPPSVQYKKYVGSKNQEISFFDEITLIVFDKRYNFPKRLQVKASSIDLVPTVLQLLEINNVSNPFQGLSIFTDRKEHPFLLCTLMDNYYTYDADGIHSYSYTYDAKLYGHYNRITADIFNDKKKQEAGMKLWFSYNKTLNSNNKIWNGIFGNPLYQEEVKNK
jgi:phosphoglycerol transferase MdoB-like AlkP superfamily enzyme